MTQLHPRDIENRQQNRFSERRFSKKKPQLQPVECENVAYRVIISEPLVKTDKILANFRQNVVVQIYFFNRKIP